MTQTNLAQSESFDSHAQERTILFWLMGQGFFVIVALLLVYVASNAIFLSTFGAARIPLVYSATGVVASLLSYGGLVQLQQRWSLAKIAIGPNISWRSFILRLGSY